MKRAAESISQHIILGSASAVNASSLDQSDLDCLGDEGKWFFANKKDLRNTFLKEASVALEQVKIAKFDPSDKKKWIRAFFKAFRLSYIPKANLHSEETGVTKFMEAVLIGDKSLIEKLLTEGADVTQIVKARTDKSSLIYQTQRFRDIYLGRQPAHEESGLEEEFAALLINLGSHRESKHLGRNPLTAAVAAENIGSLEILCDYLNHVRGGDKVFHWSGGDVRPRRSKIQPVVRRSFVLWTKGSRRDVCRGGLRGGSAVCFQ